MKTRVAMLFGGKSVEHEVSVISGIQAVMNMDTDKYAVIPVYMTKRNEMYIGEEIGKIESYKNIDELLKKSQRVIMTNEDGKVFLTPFPVKMFGGKKAVEIDVAFPVVHGTNVEDGAFQGYLKTMGIPFVGCDVTASAIGMDKYIMKAVLKECDVPVLDAQLYTLSDYAQIEILLDKVEKGLGYPVIVKPVNLGSSVGISVAKNRVELTHSVDDAFKYATKVLVEHAITNLREINCSVLGDENDAIASECEEPLHTKDILSYEDKYVSNAKGSGSKGMASVSRKIPAELSPEKREEVRELAVRSFKALGCNGVSRIDFMIDEDNGKTASYGEDDKQYRINYENEQSFNGKKCLAENVKSATKTIDGGYVVEAAFKWTDIKPANGTKIGLEFQINDAKDGKRIGTLSWYDETGMGWSGSNVYGTVELTGKTGSNGGGSSVNPGTSDTKPDVKPDGKQDTTIETSRVEITVSGGKKAEASVTITKDAQGNVTSANATVSGSKGTLTADVVKQLIEAAGTEDLTIIVQVKNTNGDVKYTVSVSAKNVKHNKSLKAFVVNRKTGEYELINSKTYKAEDGNLNVSFGKKGDYVLLTTKEAARIEKEILKTIAPKKAKATVKKGKTTEFKLDSKLNQNNVKKVTYKTSKKSIATVNKNGKIKANRKGTVTIKATVTLKNGKTKTVSMKIVVR